MQPDRITDRETLEQALLLPAFLLFKHSPYCPTSARAFAEYQTFVEGRDAPASGWIDVVAERDLARWVAELTGIRHQSPQALLFREGAVRWHESHYAITASSLAEALRCGS